MNLNIDLIELILAHLHWMHTTAWDGEEFRPDAHRAPFTRYALISPVWTLPSQTYIYRSTHIHWTGHLHSVRSALANPVKGPRLRDAVRVLDLHLCAKDVSIAVPYNQLATILTLFPRVVELRLRFGKGVQFLWSTPAAEKKLKAAVDSLPNLRAIQVATEDVVGQAKSNHVLTQLFQLIDASNLAFISLVSNDEELPPHPEFVEDAWKTISLQEAGDIHWPIQLNTSTTPHSQLLRTHPASPQVDSSIPQSVYPDTLLLYSMAQGYQARLDILKALAPTLRTLISPYHFFASERTMVYLNAPHLSKLILHDRTSAYPSKGLFQHACVLDPQDWESEVLEAKKRAAEHAGDEPEEEGEPGIMAPSWSLSTWDYKPTCGNRFEFGEYAGTGSMVRHGFPSPRAGESATPGTPIVVERGLIEAFSGWMDWKDAEMQELDYNSSLRPHAPTYTTMKVLMRKTVVVAVDDDEGDDGEGKR